MISLIFDYIWHILWICLVYRFLFKFMPVIWRMVKTWYIYPALGWTLEWEKYTHLWTVVTGCTDGIGKAYTEELARRGCCRFILIGRNIEKLKNLEKCLIADNPSSVFEIHLYVFDFDTSNYSTLPSLTDIEVGILVNCVGISVDNLVPFAEQPDEMALKIMRVNAMSTIRMTQIVLPQMLMRDHGIIVNVTSVTGFRPLPFMCTYGASKAATSFTMESLKQEYSHTNLHFQTVMPFLVATKLARYHDGGGLGVASCSTFARQAVDSLGIQSWTTGCVLHDLEAAVCHFTPQWLGVAIMKPLLIYQRKRWQKVNEEQRKKAC